MNNAGINPAGLLHEVGDEVIERTLGVNVKGRIYGCRAAIPPMLDRGGSIIIVSAVNGLVAEPFLAVYAASKGASIMLTKGVALDYAKRGIRCNVVCPGGTDTPINYAHAPTLSTPSNRLVDWANPARSRTSSCCWPRTRPVS